MSNTIAEGIFTQEQIDYVNGVKDEDLRSALLHQVRLRDNMESDRNSFEKQASAENKARPGFEKELESLINRYSMESGSNTPDYILVGFLKNSLENFHQATRLRDNWYGGKRSVINDQAEKWVTENETKK